MAVQPKKKILVLTSSYPSVRDRVAGSFVHELNKRLAEDFEVYALSPRISGVPRFEVMNGVNVYRHRQFFFDINIAGEKPILPLIRKNPLYILVIPLFIFFQLYYILRIAYTKKVRIFHAHWLLPQGITAALIKKLLAGRLLVTLHGGDVFGLKGKAILPLKRFVLKAANAITVVSTAIQQEVEKNILPGVETSVVPMGVNARLFSPASRDPQLREKYNITGPFLLFVGRLSEKKGTIYLIQAMPEIIKAMPAARLMIIGGGELDAELKKLTAELGLTEYIIFMGTIVNSDLPRYYASADIFIGPSIVSGNGDTEGFGLTFVEAGMSGCWVIGTRVGGISDIINDGVNGFLIEQKSAAAIAAAVIKSQNMISAGRRNNYDKFDWDHIAAKYKALLDSL